MNDYLISDNDKQFADEFSRFVNGKMGSAPKPAENGLMTIVSW